MRLLQRTSFSGPASNHSFLILGVVCALVCLICSLCITSGESSECSRILLSLWITTLNVVGEAGSWHLFLAFLCVKFQDTNSMSVPRGNFKTLHGLFKKEVLHKTPNISKAEKKKQQLKKTDRKGKREKEKKKQHEKKSDMYKLTKSQHNIPASISTSGAFSTISSVDQPGIKNQVKSPNTVLLSNSLIQRHKNTEKNTSHSSKATRGKRKSKRRGKNGNEFPASNPLFLPSRNTLLGNILRTENDEEVMRRQILAKVEELDPLMCLPKVLCGYSSRQRHKKYSFLTKTTTPRPPLTEDIVSDYFHLLGIIPPIKEEDEHANLKKATEYLISIKKSNKKKKVDKNKKTKKDESDEDNVQDEESGSSSNESDEPTQYSRYPARNKYREKFNFNRNRGKPENDISNESDIDVDDEEVDDLFDKDDIKYIVERDRVHKWMEHSGSHSDENWWDPFEEPKVTMPYYYPHPDPTYDPLAADDIYSSDTAGGITGWVTNMLSNFMPRISWMGGKKDEDDFQSDPFFTSFDGRSLNNRQTRTFSSDSKDSHTNLPNSLPTPSNLARSGKQIGLQQLFGGEVNSRQLDQNSDDDPTAKYRTAVSIGNRVASPLQCDFIYNGCPLSYEEIIAIINEPENRMELQFPIGTTALMSPPTSPLTQATTTANMSTPITSQPSPSPTPQHIIVPLVHQQQPLSYQPRQPVPLHQYHQPTQYVLHPPQSYRPAPLQLLYNNHNHQLQLSQQHPLLTHIPRSPQIPSFQQQQALLSNVHGITAEAVKRTTTKPHKTKFHQELPSGEVEISVHYKPDEIAESTKLPHGNFPTSNGINVAQNWNFPGGGMNPYTGALPSNYEHNFRINPFNQNVVKYTSYEFFPPNGYKIQKKKGEWKETSNRKGNRNHLKDTSSSGSSLSTSDENDDNGEVLGAPKPEKRPSTNIKRRQQGLLSIYKNNSKGKRKNKRKQTIKKTPSAAPLRPSSPNRQSSHPKQQQQTRRPGKRKKMNGNNINIMRKKNGKDKMTKKKGIQQNDDDSSGSNSSSSGNSSGGASASSNEQLQSNKRKPGKKHFSGLPKTRRRTLKKKKRRKPHLHKQSSESIEVKKRPEIAASNAIYPIYGHPFPPPYAGYYHTLNPSTPTSPSFFSYFFGR